MAPGSTDLVVRMAGVFHGFRWIFLTSDVYTEEWRVLPTLWRKLQSEALHTDFYSLDLAPPGLLMIITGTEGCTLFLQASSHLYTYIRIYYLGKARKLLANVMTMEKISIPPSSIYLSWIHNKLCPWIVRDRRSPLSYLLLSRAKSFNDAVGLAWVQCFSAGLAHSQKVGASGSVLVSSPERDLMNYESGESNVHENEIDTGSESSSILPLGPLFITSFFNISNV